MKTMPTNLVQLKEQLPSARKAARLYMLVHVFSFFAMSMVVCIEVVDRGIKVGSLANLLLAGWLTAVCGILFILVLNLYAFFSSLAFTLKTIRPYNADEQYYWRQVLMLSFIWGNQRRNAQLNHFKKPLSNEFQYIPSTLVELGWCGIVISLSMLLAEGTNFANSEFWLVGLFAFYWLGRTIGRVVIDYLCLMTLAQPHNQRLLEHYNLQDWQKANDIR
jgi:hypothetical protein